MPVDSRQKVDGEAAMDVSHFTPSPHMAEKKRGSEGRGQGPGSESLNSIAGHPGASKDVVRDVEEGEPWSSAFQTEASIVVPKQWRCVDVHALCQTAHIVGYLQILPSLER